MTEQTATAVPIPVQYRLKWIVVIALSMAVVANISAVVDWYFHPEIEYFDSEHLVIGLFSAAIVGLMEFLILQYILRLRLSYLALQEAHQRMTASTDRFRSIFESSLDAMLLTSMDGTILAANGAACAMFERSEEELRQVGRRGIADMNDPRVAAAVEERRRTGRFAGELRMLRKSGAVFPVEISTKVLNDSSAGMETVMVLRDLSSRHRIEDELRLSEEKFSKAFYTSPDAITITSLKEGRYLNVNKGFCTISGYTPDEVLGRTVKELNIWQNYDMRSEFARQLLETGELTNMETGFQFKNGKTITGLISARLIDIGGEQCILTTTRDISELKQTQRELIRMNEELERRVQERTSELTEAVREMEAFNYSVSHDLRSPIRAIDAFASILRENYEQELDDEAKRLLTNIRASTAKIDLLINGLLTLSRVGKQDMTLETIAMEPIVQEVINEERRIRQDSGIEFILHPLPPARCDAVLIRQVWVNLISNAVKYSSGKKTPVIEIGAAVEEEMVWYSVTDNGIGFDQQYSDKLFGIFQRLHSAESFEGVGIGLSTVKRIVQRFGGAVSATGIEGQGATFRFSLPKS
jgi:PAS domain S-box-containing protein